MAAAEDLEFDVVIVGAGLSAAAALHRLREQAATANLGTLTVGVLEARERVGGRLLSHTFSESGAVCDLGGAWIWPGQTHIAALVEALSVDLVQQQSGGDLSAHGIGRRLGSYRDGRMRVARGAQSIVERVFDAEAVDSGDSPQAGEGSGAGRVQTRLFLDTAVSRVSTVDGSVVAADGRQFRARLAVIMAIPPRLAGQIVIFDPPLPPALSTALTESTTWMAATRKLAFVPADVAVAGKDNQQVLQGRSVAEVYDSDGCAVAFCFGGTSGRWDFPEMDWSKEKFTSGIEGAAAMGQGHPKPAPPILSQPVDGKSVRLAFAGAETDTSYSAGLLDGAAATGVRAADSVVEWIVSGTS